MSPERKAAMAIYQKAYRARKRRAGVCGWGGCGLPRVGTWCVKHKAQLKASHRKLKLKRRKLGLCTKCGQPKP